MKVSQLIKQLQVMEKLYGERDVQIVHEDDAENEDAVAMEIVTIEKDSPVVTLYIREA